ncbi:MAG: hypothetical protein H0V62_12575 [Gammaproteobacteria bacterium]|jgi:hypothetical protein|nr:hypothetical protein [Gammaproteobacteria bacterium]
MFFLASVLSAFPLVCHAAVTGSGNDLLEACAEARNPDAGLSFDDVGSAYCLGYLHGYIDRERITIKGFRHTPLICLPAGVTNGQLTLVLLNYMQDHPDVLHWGADLVTMNALLAAFSCD